MIKLIVSDMDGTLLNDEKQIDKRIYDLLPKMLEEGIRFVDGKRQTVPLIGKGFSRAFAGNHRHCGKRRLCGAGWKRTVFQRHERETNCP